MRRLLSIAALVSLALLPVQISSAQAIKPSDNLSSIAASQRRSVIHAVGKISAELAARPSIAAKSGAVEGDSTDSDPGMLSGYVRGDVDVRSAWVLAVSADLTGSSTSWQTVPVNDDGSFAFYGLHSGMYILMAGADRALSQFYDHVYTIDQAMPVPVAPGSIWDGIEFDLESAGSGSGSIGGFVQSALDSTRLGGAEVYAYDIDNPYYTYSVRTNDAGEYFISNLSVAHYVVHAAARGHFARYYDNATTPEQATAIQVSDSMVTDTINFVLPVSSSISGRITDQDNNPVANADISVTGYFDSSPDSLFGYYSYWTQSDENGDYTVSDIDAGTYFVQAQVYREWFFVWSWYDGATVFEDATPIIVAGSEAVSGIDLELNLDVDTGRVIGRVIDADGGPIANAILRLEPTGNYPINFSAYSNVVTDADGRYAFNDFPVGEYVVALDYFTEDFYLMMYYENAFSRESATPILVNTDETTSGIDFAIPRADGVIEGTVADADGNPLANASVYASGGQYFYPIDLASGYGYAYAETDENGAYKISGLLSGDYYVNASSCVIWECVQRWWPNAEQFGDAQVIVVADGQSDPTPINFTLPITQGTATMSGTVYHADGNALAGATVTASMTTDGISDSLYWFAELPTRTDSSGHFAFHNLPPANYTVHATFGYGYEFAIQWFDGADSPGAATVIALADGDIKEGIDFVLDPKPNFGSIAGRVVLDDSTSIGRAYVEVSPFYWDYTASAINPAPYYAVTDSDGSFEIPDLPNGPYHVNVFAQGARVYEPGHGGQYEVEVTGGETVFVEVVMMRTDDGGGAISGSVLSSDGDQLKIAVVLASVDDDPHRTFTAISSTDGSYDLIGLPPGDYLLWSFAPYHTTAYYDNVYDPSQATRLRIDDTVVSGINFELDRMYYIADDSSGGRNSSYVYGRVADEDGAPLAQALVYAHDDAGEVLQSVRTHADGMYEMSGLVPGNGIRIKATHAGYATTFHDGAGAFDESAHMVLRSGRFEINFALKSAVSTGRNDKNPELPGEVTLVGNYPNPFGTETQIAFTLSSSLSVNVTVFDAIGRQVTELPQGHLSSGDHRVRWDGTSVDGKEVTSGMYFYRVVAGESVRTGRMMVVR